MGIFGDIGLAFLVLLFAFGMADFISRGSSPAATKISPAVILPGRFQINCAHQ